MTVEELRKKINAHADKYGVDKPLLETYEVDPETYVNVCQFLFSTKAVVNGQYNTVKIVLGKNHGPLFKNVELILKGDKI